MKKFLIAALVIAAISVALGCAYIVATDPTPDYDFSDYLRK